jgi:hypothetical protein
VRCRLSDQHREVVSSGHQALSWIGAARFSGAAGELRHAGGVLAADLDGDRVADFLVTVTGRPTLTPGDFDGVIL